MRLKAGIKVSAILEQGTKRSRRTDKAAECPKKKKLDLWKKVSSGCWDGRVVFFQDMVIFEGLNQSESSISQTPT